jgi:acetyltransferase-like isoleucine patch superfamily enzyme
MLYAHQVDWREGLPWPSKAEGEAITIARDEPLTAEDLHFLDCVAERTAPITDGREGVRVLKVLSRAQDSLSKQDATDQPRNALHHVFVHESSYVDEGVSIGPGTKVWHFSHILNGSRIGAGCVIGQNVSIGPDVQIGDRCKLQNNVSVFTGVTLENGVFCGPSAVFTNVLNPRAEIERKDEFRPTLVGRGATIGANATIVCGHNIGAYAFVAAGAVVTNDVPPYALVAGVPARRVAWVSAAGERLGDDLVCPRTGARYREVEPNRLEEITP